MKNFKVSKKLFVSFDIILLLFIVSIAVGLFSLNGIKVQLTQFYNGPWQTRAAAQSMQTNLAEQQKNLFRAIATTDDAIITPALADVEKYTAAAEETFNLIKQKALTGNGQKIQNLRDALDKWIQVKDQALALAVDTSNSSNEISQYMQENSIDVIQTVDTCLQDLVTTTNTNGDSLIADTTRTQTTTAILLITMCIISLVISMALCIYITRGIVSPLNEIRKAADEISQGNLNAQINYHSKDELGQVSDSMRDTLVTLNSYINEIDKCMSGLAAGDLTVRPSADFRGNFIAIQDSILRLLGSLNDTLAQINQSADQVAGGSEQVSSGAQALSQGATEQASSVEELAATINEISQQVEKNAVNAQEASTKAVSVGEEMNGSNRKMQEMIAAMNEISSSSNEIGKIIKTIEDIAFQTNILALNAAVEAARAGAAGKGFAVVADEVRNLASKSAGASQNTAALIESSLRAVENGTQIARQTAESLVSVVEGAKEVTDTINRISQASKAQAESIAQVTQGVDQISSVVQTNSATAEESAAASEELSSQAQVLKTLVGRFQLKAESGSGPIEAGSPPPFSSAVAVSPSTFGASAEGY